MAINYPDYFTDAEKVLIAFYNNGYYNHHDDSAISLREIRSWFNDSIESVNLEARHDWIQWVFPNDQPSAFNPNAPVIVHHEVYAYLRKDLVITNLQLMCAWLGISILYSHDCRSFEIIYERVKEWYLSEDHNNLRVTRILRFLKLAGFALEYNLLMDALNTIAFKLGRTKAMDYWIKT